ncbi:MAG: alcohol dehydrogenase catalytic domain-containing protein [Patescibacteria group bacterium]
MKTKAAVLINIGGPLTIEELEIPKLQRGQTLIKVLFGGLCHSNVNEIKGRKGAEFIPHLLGHEASGEVMEIGDGVSKVKPGDYVACTWVRGAGLEAPSVRYQSSKGAVNAGACSVFSEYAVISENRLVVIPKAVEPQIASLLGCAVQVGAGIVDKHQINAGHRLAVFGIGGLGASALMRAASLGVKCHAFDIVPWKLKWVKEELKVIAINPSDAEIEGLKGTFDYSIECSGSKTAMEMAYEFLKPTGTAIIAGNLEPGTKISIDYWGLLTGKVLRGTRFDMCFPDQDIPFYAKMYLNGSLPINKLVSKIYELDNVNAGIDDLTAGRLLRGVIRCSKK